MKTFRILSGVIPIKLRFQLNQIITIIAALCNLQDRLVWTLCSLLLGCQIASVYYAIMKM